MNNIKNMKSLKKVLFAIFLLTVLMQSVFASFETTNQQRQEKNPKVICNDYYKCSNVYIEENEKIIVICENKEYEIEALVISTKSEIANLRINGEIVDLRSKEKKIIADGSILTIENILLDKKGAAYFSLDCSYSKNNHLPLDTSIDLSRVFKNKIKLFDNPDVVVGDTAPGSDVIAAIEIISNIQQTMNRQLSAAKISSEVVEIKNIISIGNPCDNPITEKISGIISCTLNLNKGQGFIGFYNHNNYVQAVIAGYSSFETRMAVKVFNQALYSDGDFFIVEGEDFNNVRIRKISSLSYDFQSSTKYAPQTDYEIDYKNKKNDPVLEKQQIHFENQKKEHKERYYESEEVLSPPAFPDEKTASLYLKKGWNLVSLPGSLVRFLESDCEKKPVGFVYLKNEKRYVSLKDASIILGSEFSNYLSENAFWIYSYVGCEQKVVVNDFERKIVLDSGWNLVPSVRLKCGFDQQFWWNPEIQEWQSIAFGLPNEGMIVKSANKCEE